MTKEAIPIILSGFNLPVIEPNGQTEIQDTLPFIVQKDCIDGCKGGTLPQGCPITPERLMQHLSRFGVSIDASSEAIKAQIPGITCNRFDPETIARISKAFGRHS